jgi:hypothetical protein
MDNRTATKDVRRYNTYIATINSNIIHLRNPWVRAWWSAALPGFGHLNLGIYIKGFILIIWEIVINTNSRINEAMIYSFNGKFDMAKEVVNTRWVLLYIPVYIYAIWDSYRQTIDLNRHYLLAESENAPIVPFKMTGIALNYLDKRNPWVALVWTILFPGLGHLYLHRITTGFFLISWCSIIIYFSHTLQGIHYLALGFFEEATTTLDSEWLLFLPSLYCFAIFESYTLAVEYNKLYKKEQRQFLEKNYQQARFQFIPSKEE